VARRRGAPAAERGGSDAAHNDGHGAAGALERSKVALLLSAKRVARGSRAFTGYRDCVSTARWQGCQPSGELESRCWRVALARARRPGREPRPRPGAAFGTAIRWRNAAGATPQRPTSATAWQRSRSRRRDGPGGTARAAGNRRPAGACVNTRPAARRYSSTRDRPLTREPCQRPRAAFRLTA
jgi:hypothetical protein